MKMWQAISLPLLGWALFCSPLPSSGLNSDVVGGCECVVIGKYNGSSNSDKAPDSFSVESILKGRPIVGTALTVKRLESRDGLNKGSAWIICVPYMVRNRQSVFEAISGIDGAIPYNRENLSEVLKAIDGRHDANFGKGDVGKVLARVPEPVAEPKLDPQKAKRAIGECESVSIAEYIGPSRREKDADLFRIREVLKGPPFGRALILNRIDERDNLKPGSAWIICVPVAVPNADRVFETLPGVQGVRPYKRDNLSEILNAIDGRETSLFGKGDIEKILSTFSVPEQQSKKSEN